LKRLFVELVPDIFPFVNSFKVIEDHWARFIELAADDDATLGEVERCIALAEALIRVARLGKVETTSLLLSSLSANNQELAVRVRRLLKGDSVTKSPRRFCLFPWGFSLGLLGLSVLILYRGDMLYPIYSVLELLFR
jgi:hypothetical protein